MTTWGPLTAEPPPLAAGNRRGCRTYSLGPYVVDRSYGLGNCLLYGTCKLALLYVLEAETIYSLVLGVE